MDWKQIDKEIIARVEIKYYLDLTALESLVFDLKYKYNKKNHEISYSVRYGLTKVKQIVKSIRCKYMEYINVKEV